MVHNKVILFLKIVILAILVAPDCTSPPSACHPVGATCPISIQGCHWSQFCPPQEKSMSMGRRDHHSALPLPEQCARGCWPWRERPFYFCDSQPKIDLSSPVKMSNLLLAQPYHPPAPCCSHATGVHAVLYGMGRQFSSLPPGMGAFVPLLHSKPPLSKCAYSDLYLWWPNCTKGFPTLPTSPSST